MVRSCTIKSIVSKQRMLHSRRTLEPVLNPFPKYPLPLQKRRQDPTAGTICPCAVNQNNIPNAMLFVLR